MSGEKYYITAPPPGFERSTFYRPAVDISFYLHHPGATLSTNETVVTIASDVLASNPSALLEFLNYQTQLPPRPQICIKGDHTFNGESVGYIMTRGVRPSPDIYEATQPSVSEAGIDSLNNGGGQTATESPPNQPEQNPDTDDVRANSEDNDKGNDQGLGSAMKNVVEMFCQSDREKKAFIIDRTVTNWETTILEAHIRALLKTLKYVGNLSITFPITQTKLVVVASSTTPDDYAPFIRVSTVWPYANKMADDEARTLTAGAGEEERICTAQSEDEWWEIWNGSIAVAVLEKRRGLLGIKDVIMRAFEGRFRNASGPDEEWGTSEEASV